MHTTFMTVHSSEARLALALVAPKGIDASAIVDADVVNGAALIHI